MYLAIARKSFVAEIQIIEAFVNILLMKMIDIL